MSEEFPHLPRPQRRAGLGRQGMVPRAVDAMTPHARALELAVERSLDWEQRALAAEALLSALARSPADARAEAAALAGDPHPCARVVREAWLREARERSARIKAAEQRWRGAR